MKYSNWWKIDWTWFDGVENSANLKQGVHIHQSEEDIFMLLNTFSRNKRRENCEESRWLFQSALVWTFSNIVFRCQNLIVSEASTHGTFNLVGPWNTHPNKKATKIHTLRPLTYELCFQNSSITSTLGGYWYTLTNSFSHFYERIQRNKCLNGGVIRVIKLRLILGDSGDQELGWVEVRLKQIKS